MDKRIFMAIEYVEFYRKIYFLVYPIEFKQMLYEMITDEQNHAIKYMHLYQKY
jgi:rubrerythrin